VGNNEGKNNNQSDGQEVKLTSIFNEAIRIESPSERDAFVKSACGDDTALLTRIEALLKVHFEDKGHHKSPRGNSNSTLETPPLTEGSGMRIGRYKLLQLIGEGGFGVVYMAEQEEPIRRKVALKIIKLGMDTKQVIARFEAERQALALMDHPNIAKVFDAGATDTGRPYFVMELVKGIPITEYCDKNNLDTQNRLELFIDVCKAVQHAHQKGIIHRDIKPSNVMITLHDSKPVPKIIDFGIAKATQQRLTEKTLFTEYRQFVGTPEYMSPEQAEMSGLDIDTRSDIYSLGVLLYELLTGTTPFETSKLRNAAYDEIRRIIREEEPPRPSTRLSTLGEALTDIANRRDAQPNELRKIVRGDLDWVAMKAMEKDRTRRYETANEMAMDIERHLGDEPVSAGPPGVRYRLSKFTRRHRTAVASGLLVAAAIVAGFIVSTVMYFRAERQASISQAVNEFLNNDLLASFDPDRAKGHEITVIEVLDAAAKKLEGKFKDAPSIEASIRNTLGVTYRNLGKYKAAEPHLERAIELRRGQFGEEHPDTLHSMNNLGWLYNDQGRYKEAEPLFVKVLEISRRVLGEEHPDTLGYMACLGWLYSMQGRYNEAEPLLVKALEIQRRVLGEEHPDTLLSMHSLGWSYSMQGRYNEAEPLLVKALEGKRRVLGEERSETLWTMGQLGELYNNQGRYNEAEQLLAKAMEIQRRVLGEEHPATLWSMHNLGRSYSLQGRYNEAEPLLVKALEIQRRVLGEEHPDTLWSMHHLGWLYERQGRYNEAEPLFVQSLEIGRRVRGEEHPDTLNFMNILGLLYEHQGRYNEAEPLLDKTLEIRRRVLGEENSVTLKSMSQLGWVYYNQGRYNEAEPLWVKTLEIGQRVLGKDHPDTLRYMNDLAWLMATCRTAELRNGAKAIEHATKACKLTNWKNAGYINTLAAAYAEAGDFDSAVKWQKEAINLLTGKEPAEWRTGFDERLKLYQSGNPYHESISIEGLE
jgi:eukaryotic-like serine/threonine-protein kinase